MDLARADYLAALGLPARYKSAKDAQALAQSSLARLEAASQAQAALAQPKPQAPAAAQASPAPLGRRVALVIGNSNYAHAERLANPANDARAVAASLRRLGFAEVIERYDVTLNTMTETVKNFGDKAAGADWAVVYYAGHGLEMSGITYLVPVDAALARDTHVPDEALALDRLLAKVETAKQLRLVILDSCRNNPFLSRMTRSIASRGIGRGLAQIEPEGGVLVAYAAKHGTTSADGDGVNSPFAAALLANIEEPGLEINFLFRRVRDHVLRATDRAQEPFLYGSLPSEAFYFKQ